MLKLQPMSLHKLQLDPPPALVFRDLSLLAASRRVQHPGGSNPRIFMFATINLFPFGQESSATGATYFKCAEAPLRANIA